MPALRDSIMKAKTGGLNVDRESRNQQMTTIQSIRSELAIVDEMEMQELVGV